MVTGLLLFQISAEAGIDEVFVEVKTFMDSKQWWSASSHVTAWLSVFFFLHCAVGISSCCHIGCLCTTKFITVMYYFIVREKFCDGV